MESVQCSNLRSPFYRMTLALQKNNFPQLQLGKLLCISCTSSPFAAKLLEAFSTWPTYSTAFILSVSLPRQAVSSWHFLLMVSLFIVAHEPKISKTTTTFHQDCSFNNFSTSILGMLHPCSFYMACSCIFQSLACLGLLSS